MLALSARRGETFYLSGGIKVFVKGFKGGTVRLAFDAPENVDVFRGGHESPFCLYAYMARGCGLVLRENSRDVAEPGCLVWKGRVTGDVADVISEAILGGTVGVVHPWPDAEHGHSEAFRKRIQTEITYLIEEQHANG